MTEEKDLEEKVEKELPQFEAGLPPSNVHNKEAAKARGFRYDSRRQCYVDSDGCPRLDKYGQYLG